MSLTKVQRRKREHGLRDDVSETTRTQLRAHCSLAQLAAAPVDLTTSQQMERNRCSKARVWEGFELMEMVLWFTERYTLTCTS